jgi:hypothetical protein
VRLKFTTINQENFPSNAIPIETENGLSPAFRPCYPQKDDFLTHWFMKIDDLPTGQYCKT